MIKMEYYGHSCFVLDFDGYRIALDPYSGVPGYAELNINANEVLCSHEHGDHNYVKGVKITASDRPKSLKITNIESFHDKERGSLRGLNTLRIFEYNGLKVMHCGDLGVLPTPQQLQLMQNLDAVLIPVGGFYTLEPVECKEFLDIIKPKMIIPMHYKSDTFGYDNIGTVDAFIKLYQNVKKVGSVLDVSGSGVFVMNL